MSVLNAGRGIPIDMDDPYLKKVTGMKQLIQGGATRNSLAVEVSASFETMKSMHTVSYRPFLLRRSQKNIPTWPLYTRTLDSYEPTLARTFFHSGYSPSSRPGLPTNQSIRLLRYASMHLLRVLSHRHSLFESLHRNQAR